jgi:hypothetical protein
MDDADHTQFALTARVEENSSLQGKALWRPAWSVGESNTAATLLPSELKAAEVST